MSARRRRQPIEREICLQNKIAYSGARAYEFADDRRDDGHTMAVMRPAKDVGKRRRDLHVAKNLRTTAAQAL